MRLVTTLGAKVPRSQEETDKLCKDFGLQKMLWMDMIINYRFVSPKGSEE